MAKKCGGCGKFTTGTEGIRCTKCPGIYHHACVGLPAEIRVAGGWICPTCKAKQPKVDNTNTPIKGAIPTSCSELPAIMTSAETGPSGLDLAHEIRCFREELGSLRSEFREFRDEMLHLKLTVSECNKRMDAIEGSVSKLESRFEEQGPARFDEIEATISALKNELNERDQDLLLNDIVISGIPETREENQIHTFKLVCVKLGLDFDERDIVYAERIGMARRNFVDGGGASEPVRPRSIAVRLTRRATREQLLRAARVRRGLTIADIGLPAQRGPPSRFYVNERLTRYNGKLFSSAREAGQRFKYRYVWTKDGRIYMRKDDGSSVQRIRSDADLTRIFSTSPVRPTL